MVNVVVPLQDTLILNNPYRSRLPIQLPKEMDSLFVTIKSPYDLNVEQELKEALENVTIVCFLRRKQKKKLDTEDSGIVTYTVFKTYYVLDLRRNVAIDSPVRQIATEDEEQKEQQFFTTTIAKVLDGQKKVRFLQKLWSKTSAKRNINFISVNVQHLPLNDRCERRPMKK